MLSGEGKSLNGIIKINPKAFNSNKLCGAVGLFEKSGLTVDKNRKFAIGRDENGALKYLDIQCN